MNKSTLAALILLVAVGVGVWLTMGEPEPPLPPPLRIPALAFSKTASPSSTEDKDVAAPESPEPGAAEPGTVDPGIDEIAIQRSPGEVTLYRSAENAWFVDESRSQPAESALVDKLERIFKEPLESDYSGKIPAENLDAYGLSAAHRIRLVLKQQGQDKLQLLVGFSTGTRGQGAGTWVMTDESGTVHRVAGVDLRGVLEEGLTTWRAKQLVRFVTKDVVRLELVDPRGKTPVKIVVEVNDEVPDGAPGTNRFATVEPADKPVEHIDRYLDSLGRLEALEFLEHLPQPDAKALDRAYEITVTLKDKTRILVALGASRGDRVYGRLGAGQDYFTVAGSAAKNLMKSLEELRARRPYEFTLGDIQQISVAYPEGRKLTLNQVGADSWKASSPGGFRADETKSRSLASNLGSLAVKDYLAVQPSDEVAGFGLSATRILVNLKPEPNKTTRDIEFILGGQVDPQDENQGTYMRLGSGGEIVVIGTHKAKAIAPALEELRDIRVFQIDKDDIAEVKLTYPDSEFTLVKRIAEEKAVWDLTTPEHIEDVNISSMLYNLARLDAENRKPLPAPPEAGLDRDVVRVSVTLTDGTTHHVTISEEVQDDGNFAVSDEPHLSEVYFTLGKHKVSNLLKKLPDFQKAP